MRDIGIRVMNELVAPFKAIQMDDTEFACLKAIVFFDPNARGLGDINRIKGLRYALLSLISNTDQFIVLLDTRYR